MPHNDLKLQDYFLFTQFSLSTFELCPLKFKKRYIENLRWNPPHSAKMQNAIRTGMDFHTLASRYFLGIDVGRQYDTYSDELRKWIDNLQSTFVIYNNYRYLPEYKLRMVSNNLRLEANFDLLIVKERSIEIWDWKTGGTVGPHSTRYAGSLQTMVYLFVLKELCRLITSTPIESISMFYWQPDPPQILEHIEYSPDLHQQFRDSLIQKCQYVLGYNFKNLPQSMDSPHCKYCEFIWLCNKADGAIIKRQEDIDDFMAHIDLDLIEELY